MSKNKNTEFYESYTSPVETCLSGDNHAGQGLLIPDYQRRYTWEEGEINRFFIDILGGLSSRNSKHSTTYLGATVWCHRKRRIDLEFPGKSIDIVDGQQRITTCILMSIILLSEIKLNRLALEEGLSVEISTWLDKEIENISNKLEGIIIGRAGSLNSPHLFPTLINEEDVRGKRSTESEYKSPIAKIINNIIKDYIKKDEENNSFNIDEFLDININEDDKDVFARIQKNLKTLEENIKQINKKGFMDDLNIDFISSDSLHRPLFSSLFENEIPLGPFAKNIKENKNFEKLIRLIQLSCYFCKATFFTIIECNDEEQAFAIFDSLNTTGVPLTAIETVKPYVIRYYNENNISYNNSNSKYNFNEIDKIIVSNDNTLDQQVKLSKEVVVYCALLAGGETLGYHLPKQRNYLRKLQGACSNTTKVHLPSEIIRRLLEYKNFFFNTKKVRNFQHDSLSPNETEQVKIINALLSESKTNLTIPILTRFFWDGQIKDNFKLFHKACLALGSFYILRRSSTQDTASIDNIFRNIMKGYDVFNGLKLGVEDENDSENIIYNDPTNRELTEIDLKNLKLFLQSQLSSDFEFTINDKNKWINHVKDMTHYSNKAKTLLKFMLLAAHNFTNIDNNDSELITRKNVVPNTSRDFLQMSNWNKDLYATLEHVAPSKPDTLPDWDETIYRDNKNINTIGNFILLPQYQNSSLRNSNWKIKKLFLKILLADNLDTRRSILADHKTKNIELPKKIQNQVLANNESFPLMKAEMLSGLDNIQNWSADLIRKRSERLTELVWDTVIDWIK